MLRLGANMSLGVNANFGAALRSTTGGGAGVGSADGAAAGVDGGIGGFGSMPLPEGASGAKT